VPWTWSWVNKPEWIIAALLATHILYLVCAYLLQESKAEANPWAAKRLTLSILLSGLLFRLLAWPLPPVLSDDLYRYRWEGLAQHHDLNPYLVRPNEAAHLHDEAYSLIPGPEFKSGYGPLLIFIEKWNYQLASAISPDPHQQAFWFKLPAALCDIATLAALAALLAARGAPAAALAWYAWSPMIIVEFWGSGHNDSVPVFLVTLALLAAARQRWNWAIIALSLATSAKPWPLMLLPIFIAAGRRWWQWMICFPIFALTSLPYWTPRWPEIIENARFMSGFLGGWRNNDSLFGLLMWAAGDIYLAKYAAFAIVGAAVLWVTLLRWPIERACLASIVVMLVVSANVHPWYLTWLFPMLALVPWPPLLLWAALMPLGYQVLIGWRLLGEWNGSTPSRWWIYAPVFSYTVICFLVRFKRRGVS